MKDIDLKMSLTNLSALKFPNLKYDVSLINQRLIDYPELDCFMFLQYFDVSASGVPTFQLLAYPHGNTQGSTLGYHEEYYDCEFPDVLTPFDEEVAELSAPVIFAPNVIARASIVKLIGSGQDMADALIFIPKTSTEHRLYYSIKPAKLVDGHYVFIPIIGGAEFLDTNPSPPATIESVGRV